MPTLDKPGTRLAAAGAAAATLALAAGSPAFAQEGTENGFNAWLDTDQILEVGFNEAEVGIEVPESAAATAIAAGAVVFFVMRRRKTAASWE